MSDLRTRIARLAEAHGLGWIDNGKPDVHCYCGYRPRRLGESWHYHLADAVIRELDLENRITSAICGYAGSEQMALTHHDPNRGGTELDALTRLISEAPKIARYAMTYRPDWKADE